MRPDLNLLVILDALCRLGSVSQAAEAVSLSQPAISHALNRLRAATGDPLFTRAGRGLVPTPRALALAREVAAIVAAGQACLRPETFDPARDAPRFRLGISDYAGLTLLPGIVAAVAAEAPLAVVEALPVGPGVLRQLEEGVLDLSFWGTAPPPAPYLYRRLFDESFVLVLRRGHPAIGPDEKPPPPDVFPGLSHAVVSLGDPGQSPVDQALARAGMSRKVVLSSPSFAANLAAVAGSDLVATIPARLVRRLPAGLVALPLPVSVPDFAYGMIWHPRSDASAALRWLRGLIERVTAASGDQALP
ncbi:LysR family transcriptional regulator [Tabrizicola sp.]|jgi:DNA-binding transcriptional LysR family regulator|uniref:LysR family transcriptional regulator n=1 Tax=Tabrizicola sp. TaxID=2005166 RepID=UPI001A491890|nr:LysR family transcriptional regulator [Tabrizicola sp.]MBL9062760.1 LysR family transcriptional regulator [Tabrizicola sp.]